MGKPPWRQEIKEGVGMEVVYRRRSWLQIQNRVLFVSMGLDKRLIVK